MHGKKNTHEQSEKDRDRGRVRHSGKLLETHRKGERIVENMKRGFYFWSRRVETDNDRS